MNFVYIHVLVLDDDEDPRLSWFRKVLGSAGFSCTLTQSPHTALCAMKTTQYDIVFLDHDIRDVEWDGSRVLNHVLYNPDMYLPPKFVWAHSENPTGRDNIISKAKSAGIPYRSMGFGSFMEAPEDFLAQVAMLLDVPPLNMNQK